MRIVTCLLTLALLATAANAQEICPAEGPQIVVYFDEAGTMRAKDSPGAGVMDDVWLYGEGFSAELLSGAQYSVDYGASLQWMADMDLPGATIGSSPTGIALSFAAPLPGAKFLIHRARVMWTADCTDQNADGPVVLPHPNLGPVAATIFPSQELTTADGARSQTCQFVEMDIKAQGGACPAPISINNWKDKDGKDKGGKIKIAILGSMAGVDAFDIDQSSLRLEGAMVETAFLADVATANGSTDCIKGSDGRLDLVAEFRKGDVVANIPTPNQNDFVTLTITGCYIDGMPFTASNVVRVVGNIPDKFTPIGDSDDSDMSYPTPNPFNPVTRFNYTVPSTQHVRLAVYDIAGRLVEELVNEVKGSGQYVIEWDAGTLPSGVYFYRLETGSQTIVRRATLLK